MSAGAHATLHGPQPCRLVQHWALEPARPMTERLRIGLVFPHKVPVAKGVWLFDRLDDLHHRARHVDTSTSWIIFCRGWLRYALGEFPVAGRTVNETAASDSAVYLVAAVQQEALGRPFVTIGWGNAEVIWERCVSDAESWNSMGGANRPEQAALDEPVLSRSLGGATSSASRRGRSGAGGLVSTGAVRLEVFTSRATP
jgi:hypothetical protein